jgi:hypothetical protein
MRMLVLRRISGHAGSPESKPTRHGRISRKLRKDPLGWCIIAVLALLVVVALARQARAHSWYDPDCCSDRDCEPVRTTAFVASDPRSVPVMVVTTSFGTKPVTQETKIRQSRDNRMHACIYQEKLICLYLPPSN